MAKKNFEINIDFKFCKSCGICYWICPTHAIVKGELEAPKIENNDKCIGCMQCANLCPDFAINIVESESANLPS
ncbi:MAG: 4Fe-4S binding protein [Thermotogae bacterium]|jgi:2-oxoglutarate ferredoxin oxidoreductase subunit delta|nr:4Fe-4S binding protein [Thermotogota bacterium]MCL5033321.1 4Fe-4S binding protein [Thermotogota bacterium]